MKGKFFLLLSAVLVSCSSARKIDFKKPDIPVSINNSCTGYSAGEKIDTTNHICLAPTDFDTLQNYCKDKESRLLICLKFGRCY